MCSRFLFRSIQHPLSSLTINRCLSLTQVQYVAAAKPKEKPNTAAESSPIKATEENKSDLQAGGQTAKPSAASHNLVEPNKVYSDTIQRLVNEISRLSLVDVMDLNELLKKTLKIQDVPIVAAGGAAGSPPPVAPKKEDEDDEGARPTAQSMFKIRLIKFDDTKKVPVIKQVKDVVENINLVQAKKLVESIPQVLRDNLSKADAEAMKAKLEAVGGVCVIE